MKGFIFILISYFVFFKATSSFAQEPYYYTINDENGLPSNEVYQVLQDDFGYIWIGCDAGLFKYDGFEYKQYKNVNQNGRSISGLQLDSKNRIWCRNFNGQVYRVNGDSLKLIADFKQNTSSNNFTIDENCNAWIVCENKLIEFNENGKQLKSVNIPNSIGLNSFIVDVVFYKKTLYLSQSDNGILKFNSSNNSFKKLKISSDENLIKRRSAFFLKNDLLHLVSEELNGKSYVISKLSGEIFSPIRKYFTEDKNILIYKIVSFSQNEAWICTSTGAFDDKIEDQNLDHINTLLKDKKISYSLKDREGMYWFCTLTDGIFVFPSLDVLKYDPVSSLLANKNVTAIGEGLNGEVVIGMGTGAISILNSVSRQVKNVEIVSDLKLLTVKKIVSYKGVTYIAHGQLTYLKDGVYKALPFYHIRDFIILKDTFYYVSSHIVGKIAMKDLDNGDTKKHIILRKTGGRNIIINPINGKIYFVLNEGVFYYKNQKWTPVFYKGKPIYASSIAYENNKLWIASISSGLLVFKNDKFVQKFDVNSGLKESEIKFLSVSNKYVWACGNSYLYRIASTSNQIAFFNNSNGINASEVKTIAVINHYVYIGTNKGLSVFSENFPWKNSVIPNIEINSIYEGNLPIPFKNGIQLSYGHKNIYIHLASISFKSKSNFSYIYRIKGLNEEWIKIPVQNKSIVFSNLPSGEFQLEIKSINESDVESKMLIIPLFIESPIWEKGWFYILITLLSIGIIGGLFYLRVKFIHRKADQHSKFVSSQLTALKAQMNPHFMFNALNSIQDLVLERDIKNSNLYLSKFSNLMRKILDASGQEKISLNDELDILNLYLDLEKLRFGDEFTFSIICDRSVDAFEVEIPSMIIQPFIENALKHGLLHKKGQKVLTIEFQSNEGLICLIKDNGVGRKHAEEIKERRASNHRSFATNATEKRIELLNEYDKENYSFEIVDLEENGISLGTLVKIKMPL